MSEQEINNAKIYIGRRSTYSDGEPIGFSMGNRYGDREDPISLHINGNYDAGTKIYWKYRIDYNTLSDKHKNVAELFVQRMKDRQVTEYDIINGQRTRMTTGEIVSCSEWEPDELQKFRETLDTKLGE